MPILKWAKDQGSVVGFAHSGWGLEVADDQVPSFQMPAFDGIGANEYIVDVTEPNTVDFISAGDTPFVWELSIWYHTLNVGFRTRIAGETDFPCIDDARRRGPQLRKERWSSVLCQLARRIKVGTQLCV
jgi:hypothetical protein